MAGLEGIDASSMEIVDALGAIRYVFDEGGRVAKPVVRHADFVPVAVNVEGERIVEKVRFGMPGFKGRLLTNARRESLATAASWKSLFGKTHHHCLTAVSYVVEREQKTGAAYRIQRRDGKPIVTPGLCAVRHFKFASTGNEYDDLSHVQVTAPANELVATVHDRFICDLETKDARDAWMAPEEHHTDDLMALLAPAPNETLEMVPIAADVWTRRGDPEAVKPQGKAVVWGGKKAKTTLGDF